MYLKIDFAALQSAISILFYKLAVCQEKHFAK